MSTSSRNIMTNIGLIAGAAQNGAETVFPINIGIRGIDSFLSNQPPSQNHEAIEWVAYYTMIRGFLLSIEGAGIAFGNEKNKKIGLMQLAGGLFSASLGLLYQFSYLTGVVPLACVMAINSIVRTISLRSRAAIFAKDPYHSTRQALKNNELNAPMGPNEYVGGIAANIIELLCALSLAIDLPSLAGPFAIGLTVRGLFSAPGTVEKTVNTISKLTAQHI